MGAKSPPDAAARLGDLFRERQDDRLAERAVAAGLIGAADLEAARACVEAGDAPSSLAALLAAGRLSDRDVAALREALAHADFVRPASTAAPPLPADALTFASDPARQLAEFILIERLGRGGAGEVHRAWDRALGRYVAIKLPAVAIESPEIRERFQREAMAAGRLSHPNIVPVFRIGEDRGRPFLVMPFIDGQTLAGRELPLPRAIDVVRTVAEAVHVAHANGIVHRDLKPGNLMLDRDGRVHILDFGLAHLRDDAVRSMTAPGHALGTAAYMSPEQARGAASARDAATDVYGLGATLYHLATGRPPFAGDSLAAIVAQVTSADPAAPRKVRPAIPRDLETVIAKAMDKDPRRRYPTAQALAGDLGRILDHRAIEARSIGVLGRVARRTRRHGASIAIATVAAVLLAATVFAARTFLRRERAEAVAALRETARVSLDTALRLRRAGDLDGMRALLPRMRETYDRAVARAPELAELDYLMGRMHRALLDDGAALTFAEKALDKDPGYAPARYERAILLSRRWGRALVVWLDRAQAMGQSQAQAVAELERAAPFLARTRRTILDDLRALQGVAAGPNDALAARGILAYNENRIAAARGLLERALALEPDREEARLHLALTAAAERKWEEAERVYAEGLARDRGYLHYRVSLCRTRVDYGRYAEAAAEAEAATAADPSLAQAWQCLGVARLWLGAQAMGAGRDPAAEFEGALAAYGRAFALDPTRREPWLTTAMVHRFRARHRLDTGGDPMPDIAAGLAAYARAEALEAETLARVEERGRLYFLRGRHRARAGVDPAADYALAEADFTEALRRTPGASHVQHFMEELRAARDGWPDP